MEKKYTNASEELADKAQKYMAEHPGVSYSEAADEVLKADEDLARRYKYDE